MKKLFAVVTTVFIFVMFLGIFFKGFCVFFICQLSITDFGMETVLAFLMATFLVVVIDLHLTRYKFWRFCQIANMQLHSSEKKKIWSIKIASNCPHKEEIREVIEFMQTNENLMFGALKIDRIVAIQSRLKLYMKGLECNPDISCQVYEALDEFLKSLLMRFKPPFYIVLTTKYLGGF